LKNCCRNEATGSAHLAAGRGAVGDRAERLVGRDGAQDLLVVPVGGHLGLRLHLGEVDVVHHPVVLGPDLGVAGEHVVERVVLELLDDLVGVVAAGPLHGLQVLHRGRVVAGVGERRPDLRALLELVGPGAAALVEVPVPGGGEGGAGEGVRAEGVDVGDEHQADGELDALALQPELVVLLHEVHQVTAGLHGAQHVRLRVHVRGLEQERREVVVGERRRVLRDHLAAGALDGRREVLLHVLAERVVRVHDVPVLAALAGDRGAGALGQHVGVVRVVERVFVAGLAGQVGGGGTDVQVELLLLAGDGGHRERCRRRRHVEDRVGALPVEQLLRLGVGDLRLVLVVGGDHLDVLGDGLVAVLGLEVLDGHLHGLDGVLAGQVGVDAGLVVEYREDDLVAGDLAAAAAGAALSAGGEQEGRRCRYRGCFSHGGAP